jgi:antitoxin component YwqK of YwqJK toxin-antitoxin module
MIRTLIIAAAAALLAGPVAEAPAAAEVPASAVTRVDGIAYLHGGRLTSTVVERHADGSLRSRTPYLRGVRHGVAEGWYPDGTRAYRRAFRSGREHGPHTAWWEDGRPRLSERFVRGRLEGQAREWFANGRPYRVVHYLRGKEQGEQRMWYADRTPRAAYVVRDGRRYGIPGAKGCTGERNGGGG